MITLTEVLLLCAVILLWGILYFVYQISQKLQNGLTFDENQSVNAYGENMAVAMQEGLVRGQRGVSQYDGMRGS